MCYGTRAVTVVETSYAVICIETRINPITRVMFKRIKYNDFYSIVVKKKLIIYIYTRKVEHSSPHTNDFVFYKRISQHSSFSSRRCVLKLTIFRGTIDPVVFQLTLKRSHKSRKVWVRAHEPFPSDSLQKLYIRINFNLNLLN